MHKRLTRFGPLVRLLAGVSFLALMAPAGALARGDRLPEARTLLGSYLAGRIARGQHDSEAASLYYSRALQRDPGNEALMEQSLIMEATEGRMDEAIQLSKRIAAVQPTHRMARLVLGLADAKVGRYAEADDHFKASASGMIGELTGALSRAWMLSARGDVKGATDLLDGVKQAEWAQFYTRYHKALILDAGNRRSDARALHERIFRTDSKSLRTTLAYAHHASAAGDQKLARSILDEHSKKAAGNLHPLAKATQERLRGNDRLGLLVEQPTDGLAEVFYNLGELLSGEGSVSVGAIYLQLALYLKGDAPLALAALANVYETTKRYDAAITVYDRVPLKTPLAAAIDIRKALNLNQLDKVDEAKALLERQAQADPTDIRPLEALGNIMRGRKRYQEAIDYYSRAITIIGPKPDKKHWTFFYARGTCYERIKRWPQAEADLLKALQFAPEEALVLNYLGYSWVDQNRNLKQGLALIEKAVSLKPDDGYIVDSLGWAHYRLGNYKEAVKYLEKAVELKAEDPVLNDHLGDAFWRVGREVEARFQWQQALTLKPEPEDAEKIQRKLDKGLPAKPQARVVKKSKEPARAETPKKQSKLGSQRPVE
ncbi:MAG: tetratricopeptide repeat protein [Hyphomicrobiaceae bacterium]